jgi:hypothetical protein
MIKNFRVIFTGSGHSEFAATGTHTVSICFF